MNQEGITQTTRAWIYRLAGEGLAWGKTRCSTVRQGLAV